VPDAWPLQPLMLITPCSLSMSVCAVFSSSCPSAPTSASSVKITAYRLVAVVIMALTFSGVGISGVFSSTL